MLWVTCTSFQQHRSSNGCPAFLRYSMYLKMYLWNNQNQNWSPNFQSRLEFIFNFLSVWHRKHCIRSPNNRCIRSYPMMRGKGGIPPPPWLDYDMIDLALNSLSQDTWLSFSSLPQDLCVSHLFVCLPSLHLAGTKGSFPIQGLYYFNSLLEVGDPPWNWTGLIKLA